MSYTKAYVESFISVLVTVGGLYLVIQAFKLDPLAIYFIYFSSVASIAGPIHVAINRRKNEQ